MANRRDHCCVHLPLSHLDSCHFSTKEHYVNRKLLVVEERHSPMLQRNSRGGERLFLAHHDRNSVRERRRSSCTSIYYPFTNATDPLPLVRVGSGPCVLHHLSRARRQGRPQRGPRARIGRPGQQVHTHPVYFELGVVGIRLTFVCVEMSLVAWPAALVPCCKKGWTFFFFASNNTVFLFFSFFHFQGRERPAFDRGEGRTRS